MPLTENQKKIFCECHDSCIAEITRKLNMMKKENKIKNYGKICRAKK